MKKLFASGLIILFFSSCGVTLKSIVEKDLPQSYSNPLIVFPCVKSTEIFAYKLKDHFEDIFNANGKKIEMYLFSTTPRKKELTLNEENVIDKEINERIQNGNKDLLILFKPIELFYYNSGLQSASYEITGIDVVTHKEVWKAEFKSTSSFGPSVFAKLGVKKIFEQLKKDQILN